MTDATVINADCLEVMRDIDAELFTAIVTDPPYGLEFMGKEWDRFGGGRTSKPGIGERSTEWVNSRGWNEWRCANCGHLPHGGSPCRCEKPDMRRDMGRWLMYQESMRKIFAEALRVLKPGGHALIFGGTRTFHRLACAVEDAGFEIRDCLSWMYGQGFPKSLDVSKAIDKAVGMERPVVGVRSYGEGHVQNSAESIGFGGCDPAADRRLETAPATDAARIWQGYGTALKPAWEPIIVARKPLAGTVAANCLEHGTGALNVDRCRVGTEGGLTRHTMSSGQHRDRWDGNKATGVVTQHGGRWPANVVLDEEAAAMLDEQSGTRKSGTRKSGVRTGIGFHGADSDGGPAIEGSEGGASRFFYCAKASKKDRGPDNNHPTVKPVELMRWLVRLVSGPGENLILDPFAGSGTTGVAAQLEGVSCVLVESEPSYAEIIRRRLSNLQTET